MAQTYKLLCLENPLLDIIAECDTAFLAKYKLKADDTVLAEPHHIPIYEELEAKSAVHVAGGAAQNTARGAQYLLPPNSVIYVGAVGTDSYSSILDEACAQAGLATEYLRLTDKPTGRCGVCITGHNRSMVTDLGAANHYSIDHLQSPAVWAHAEKADVFYVGGYHLTVSPPAALALGKEAARRNVPFVFGVGAAFILQFFGEPLAQVLEYCDYFFMNEDEAATWAESTKLADPKDLKAVAVTMANSKKVNEKRKRVVVITHGTEPTLVAIQGEGDATQVKSYPVHPVDGKDIVDTTAAGDAFAGGFLAGLVEQKHLDVCIDMGMWLAARIIKQSGATYPYPKQTYQPLSASS